MVGREYVKLTARKINTSSIATCLIRHKRNVGKSYGVLRDAVRHDLKRILKLESTAKYNGGS
ncbi:hypothetical protein GCM10011371_35190 [Novosphingobium marinum]|nr:hypothetical protein GCM10011371_35190 [Novosphingobium marinum]